MSLYDEQSQFFNALSEDGLPPVGVRGVFGIYQYAYFERIRSSVEEDYSRVFQFLEESKAVTGGVDSERVTRELLLRFHPSSWTLAEASVPVPIVLASIFEQENLSSLRPEVLRLAGLDEAENLASWIEEWPEPIGPRSQWIERYSRGEIALVRTKTWRGAGNQVFWRTDSGVECAEKKDFIDFSDLLDLMTTPILFENFIDRAPNDSEERISEFMRRGVAEGWLRFTRLLLSK